MFEKRAISLLARMRGVNRNSAIGVRLTSNRAQNLVGKPTIKERDALLGWTAIYSRAGKDHGIIEVAGCRLTL